MKAQPADAKTRNASPALRLVFWLLAALSLGDAAALAGEPSRFARGSSVDAEPFCGFSARRQSTATQADIAAEEPVLPPAIIGAEPALDGEDGKIAGMVPSPGRPPAAAGIVAAQLPDGQPSTAFNSRAPPTA